MEEQIYTGDFECWEDVANEFTETWRKSDEEVAASLKNFPRPDAVFAAAYEQVCYDGDAVIAYRHGDKYYLVEGSHCSCHGLEDQWVPEEYDRETFIGMLDRRIAENADPYDDRYPSYNPKLWQDIKRRVEADAAMAEHPF